MRSLENSPSAAFGKRAGAVDQLGLLLTLGAAAPAVFDVPRELAAAGIFSIVLLPSIVIWLAKRALMVTDPIVILGLMWILAAGLPIFLPNSYLDSSWSIVSPQSIDAATLWMYRAWAAMSIGYWIARVFFQPSARPRSHPLGSAQDFRMRMLVGATGFAATALYLLLRGGQAYSNIDLGVQASTVQQILGELQQFSMLYVFMYLHARGRGRLAQQDNMLLAIVLAGQGLLLMASATKLIGLQLIACFVLGSAAGGLEQRKLIRQLAVGISAVCLIYVTFAFITAYRVEIANQQINLAASFADVMHEQMDAVSNAVVKLFGGTIGADPDKNDIQIFNRLSYVTVFGRLLDVTNQMSPYENALQSLFVPLYALLPRDLFGEKVQFFGSGDFAHIIGWNFGGFSVTTPGSFFWAWGFEGVVAGMMALGLVLGLLSRGAENGTVFGLIWRLLQIQMTVALLDVGADFQAVATALTRSFLVVMVFAVLIAHSSDQRRPPYWRNEVNRYGGRRNVDMR